MKGKGGKAIKTVRKKKIKQEEKKKKNKMKKKMKKKKRLLEFEPETYRLTIRSLKKYTTEHLMLNPCNC